VLLSQGGDALKSQLGSETDTVLFTQETQDNLAERIEFLPNGPVPRNAGEFLGQFLSEIRFSARGEYNA